MDAVGNWLAEAVLRTLRQLVLLAGPFATMAVAMHGVAGILASRSIALAGRWPFLLLLGWPGAVVHETGHALFCPPFGHRIASFRPFVPDPRSRVLGYVEHEWDARSRWARLGNLFIGLGPVVLSTFLVWLAAHLLLPGVDVPPPASQVAPPPVTTDPVPAVVATGWTGAASILLDGAVARILSTFAAVTGPGAAGRWQTWAFLYASLALGLAIRLSPSDLRGAASGFAWLVPLLLAANGALVALAGPDDPVLRLGLPVAGEIAGLVAVPLALSAVVALPVGLVSWLAGRGGRDGPRA